MFTQIHWQYKLFFLTFWNKESEPALTKQGHCESTNKTVPLPVNLLYYCCWTLNCTQLYKEKCFSQSECYVYLNVSISNAWNIATTIRTYHGTPRFLELIQLDKLSEPNCKYKLLLTYVLIFTNSSCSWSLLCKSNILK